jgi:hypothetical protein
MSVLLSLALAAATPLPPPPPGWTLLLGDEEARTHYDPASVRSPAEGLVSVHTLTEFREPVNQASRLDVELVLNCRARTAAFLAARIFGPGGALTGSRETALADAEFNPIEDVSVEARLHGILCPQVS